MARHNWGVDALSWLERLDGNWQRFHRKSCFDAMPRDWFEWRVSSDRHGAGIEVRLTDHGLKLKGEVYGV